MMLIEESDDDFDSLENVGDDDNVRSAISIPVGQTRAQATSNPRYSGTQVIMVPDNNDEGASRVSITPTRTSGEGASHAAGRGRTRLGIGINDSLPPRRRSPSPDRPRPGASSSSATAIRGAATTVPRSNNPTRSTRPRVSSPDTQEWMVGMEENMYSWAEARISERTSQLQTTMGEAHAYAESVYQQQFREAATAYELQYASAAAEVERRNQERLTHIMG